MQVGPNSVTKTLCQEITGWLDPYGSLPPVPVVKQVPRVFMCIIGSTGSCRTGVEQPGHLFNNYLTD